MLVIFLMDEARKPKYYEWMWGDQLPGQAAGQEEIDTRISTPTQNAGVPVPGAMEGQKASMSMVT